jgi:uncharacterized protein with GYD domain
MPERWRRPTGEGEVKFVLLVKVSAYRAKKFRARGSRAKAMADSLGLKVLFMYYTQGGYDLVEGIEAPSAEAMLAHTTWYAKQGYGTMVTMPAHDVTVMRRADAIASRPPRQSRGRTIRRR